MSAKGAAKREAMRLWQMCRVDGRVDDNRARSIVDGIVASGRRDRFDVLSRLLRLLDADEQRRSADVASAVPLDEYARSAIERRVIDAYGGVAFTFRVDPRLIGGVRIRIGSDVYDGTIRAALTAAEANFQ